MGDIMTYHLRNFAQNIQPNTFIGGIAKQGGTGVDAPIDTPFKLATKFGIAVNRISGFKVSGDDVSCRIKGSYVLQDSVFRDNTNITSYIDNDGLVGIIYQFAFRMSTNLETIHFPGMHTLQNSRVFDSTKIKTASFPSLTALILNEVNPSFLNNHLLESVSTPILTGMGVRVQGANLLTNYNAPMITSIGASGLRGCPVLLPINASLNNIISISNTCFTGSFPMNTELVMPELITAGSEAFSGNRFKSLVAPKLTTLNGNRTFFNGVNYELIDIKKCKTMGSTTGDNEMFNSLKTGCIINVNVFLATANAGNPDADLLYAKNDRGAVVNFYDDSGNYVSTL